jgi:hypothetical protein
MAGSFPDVEDILVRGSLALGYQNFVEGYSDIDTTMVVSKCDESILNNVRNIKKHIKSIFPYKFSITVVTTTDFQHDLHHHGHKPIFYSYTLGNSLSLLNKEWDIGKSCITRKLQRLDACSNISYIIYEMRNKFIAADQSDVHEMGVLCLDFFKKSKHLIRNIEFCLTDYSERVLDFNRLSRIFPQLEADYISFINCSSDDLDLLSLSGQDCERITHCINYLLSSAEKLYEYYLKKLNISEFT